MKNIARVIIIFLLGLNLILPFFVLKTSYFNPRKKRKEFEKQLKDIRKKNTSISALLNEPNAITDLQNDLVYEIQALEKLMPPKTEMIAAQKFLSQFAREANVIIVALRPVKDSMPLEFKIKNENDTTEDKKPGKKKVTKADSVNFALIELKTQGTYDDIVSYVKLVENCEDVVMLVNSLALKQASDGDKGNMEATLGIKIFYSV
ncbi:hypothetical protein ACFL3D_03845 [Candidatus Omnitrophota bacterium]